ncbi:MAG: family 20 glycosylhydrolase [Bacteroidota bacterium]|nr:family 20 glycosylhydrolase [Bacteroidota bacterium]
MYKIILLAGFLSFFINAHAQEWQLMPLPKTMEPLEDQFRIPADGIRFEITGDYHPRITDNTQWFLQRLSKKTSIPFLPGKGKVISIHISKPGEVKLKEDESYKVTINNQHISILAETDLGAIHALETLLQLTTFDTEGYYFPGVKIMDEPRFPWRGLMLDVCRHFLPVDFVKRNIDAMSAVKLNVLHLHLTEDQGFRIESKKFPQLHEKGSNGKYFTQEEMKEIIHYANIRGIRVMPEFDMPGHTTSWMVGMPELASAPGPYEIEKYFGVFDPTMDPSREFTYQVLGDFLQEMAELFPDEYMHIGGDENNGKQWDNNEDIQAFMQQKGITSNHELQAYFNKKLQKILTKNNKKMMGWDEIYAPDLPKDIVIHSWRGYNYMYRAAKRGYQSILSNDYYIDLSHNAITHYRVDPLPDTTTLTDAEQKRILGGEAPMWAELVNAKNVDSRIWPRTAAIAERLWSPNPSSSEVEMYSRLQKISLHLEICGVRHRANRELMMRRIAGKDNIANLMILANTAEPLEGYRRHGSKRYTTYQPLSRFVDITVPDAPDIITFRIILKEYLKNKSEDNYDTLQKTLLIWKNNQSFIKDDIKNNPGLQEIKDLSVNLSKLASITLKLLEKYHNGSTISHAEVTNISVRLTELQKPVAEMEIPLAEDAKMILSFLNNNTSESS